MNKINSFSVQNLNCMIDLHLHLDGAISLSSARQLAAMQGISVPANDEELLSLIRVSKDCSDLNEFLEKFEFPCSLIQTKESIRMAVANLLAELESQGVMYAEIRFAPQKSTDNGLTQEEVVLAALDGIKSARIPANLILCCMRGEGIREENIETVNVAEKFLGKGVVAIDLAGAEALFPNDNFSDIFTLARQKKIPFTIHSGEAAGPESIKTALSFGAQRIGHGVRALEDTELVKKLVSSEIPLELCPTSNVCTAIFGSIGEWPYKKITDSGLFVTINTDDPSIEGITIKEEFQKLIDEFDIPKATVKQLLLNSVNASFADDDLKNIMIEKINNEFK